MVRRRARHPAEPWLATALVAGGLGLVLAPVACLWAAASLGASIGLGVAVVGAPATLICWAIGLARLNRLYVRVSPQPRPVLEVSVTLAVVVAVAATLAWMLLIGAGGPDVPLRTS